MVGRAYAGNVNVHGLVDVYHDAMDLEEPAAK
jgi:hypothetical protein